VLLPAAVRADVSEQLDFSYYDVHMHKGMTLRELLNAASPVRSAGRTYHAYTKWNVNWHYQFVIRASGHCGIDSEHTVLTATMTLPAPADPAVARDPAFARYLAALRRHEQGHYEIARATAQAIDQGLLTLPAQDSCAVLEVVANDFANKRLGNARVTEAHYDRDTGNGRTQGATLQ
jgi:predicted secreted Zn-dependent protease